MTYRRQFLIVLAASWASALMDVVHAQVSQTPIIIGFLHVGSRETSGHFFAAFREGLAALGWKEGSEFQIEERWANGRYERLPSLAKDLAARTPSVIVAPQPQAVAAAAKAAPRTPIVHVSVGDPIGSGFAASLSRPGGMITGVTNLAIDITEKYFELLLAAAPNVRRVGYLKDRAVTVTIVPAAERAARRLKLDLQFAEVSSGDDISAAISALAARGAQALIVPAGGLFSAGRQRIVKLGLAHRWPIVASLREFAEEGALLAYGIDTPSLYRLASGYVDKILRGARPGDLPIQQPKTFELTLNLRTAKALGLTIPQELLLRSDKVIE